MKKRKQNGFVIEMMIVFMLVTFGFCMLITTFLSTLNVERKFAKQTVHMQTDLNQIGEYYLRYIEESGEQFPVGDETSFDAAKFDWMDDEAKEFFTKSNQKYQFKFEPSFSIKRGGLRDFYKTKYIWRKLVVKSSEDKVQMIIELKEKRLSDTETEYFVQNWAVGNDLTDESEAGGYQTDKLDTLKKLWRFLGLQIESIRNWEPAGDLRDLVTFFNTVDSNWREAMSDDL